MVMYEVKDEGKRSPKLDVPNPGAEDQNRALEHLLPGCE